MKTRLGFLLALALVVSRCGAAPTEVAHNTVTPAVSPIPRVATPTPNCRNFKLCQGL
jgi:hypothetical protein